MMAFVCPSCLNTLRVPEEYAGKRGKCKLCGAPITITLETHMSEIPRVELSVTEYLKKNADLMTAVEAGNVEDAKRLLNEGANVNTRDPYGVTPLHIAARNGNLEVAEVLINHEALVNAIEHNGCTPLHSSASRGLVAMAKLLLTHGANVNVQDKDRETPLHHAARSTPTKETAIQMVTLLLAAGADINARCKGGHTPLNEAGELGYPEVVEVLKRRGGQ